MKFGFRLLGISLLLTIGLLKPKPANAQCTTWVPASSMQNIFNLAMGIIGTGFSIRIEGGTCKIKMEPMAKSPSAYNMCVNYHAHRRNNLLGRDVFIHFQELSGESGAIWGNKYAKTEEKVFLINEINSDLSGIGINTTPDIVGVHGPSVWLFGVPMMVVPQLFIMDTTITFDGDINAKTRKFTSGVLFTNIKGSVPIITPYGVFTIEYHVSQSRSDGTILRKQKSYPFVVTSDPPEFYKSFLAIDPERSNSSDWNWYLPTTEYLAGINMPSETGVGVRYGAPKGGFEINNIKIETNITVGLYNDLQGSLHFSAEPHLEVASGNNPDFETGSPSNYLLEQKNTSKLSISGRVAADVEAKVKISFATIRLKAQLFDSPIGQKSKSFSTIDVVSKYAYKYKDRTESCAQSLEPDPQITHTSPSGVEYLPKFNPNVVAQNLSDSINKDIYLCDARGFSIDSSRSFRRKVRSTTKTFQEICSEVGRTTLYICSKKACDRRRIPNDMTTCRLRTTEYSCGENLKDTTMMDNRFPEWWRNKYPTVM